MPKPVGAITVNKCISWSVKIRTAEGIETLFYRDLKSLSQDLGIHRSVVHRIYNGKSTAKRKNILGIEKLVFK